MDLFDVIQKTFTARLSSVRIEIIFKTIKFLPKSASEKKFNQKEILRQLYVGFPCLRQLLVGSKFSPNPNSWISAAFILSARVPIYKLCIVLRYSTC